jgi:hypothetical protein
VVCASRSCLTYHLTVREKRAEYFGARDFMKPYWFNYGKYIAQDHLVVLVAMTYAVIAPLILVPCLFFFAMGILVYRHQLLYVYETYFQTGGQFWPKAFRRYIFALFIAQVGGRPAGQEFFFASTLVGLVMARDESIDFIKSLPSPDRLSFCNRRP